MRFQINSLHSTINVGTFVGTVIFHQQKLESIKARRLNMQQRTHSGIKSALWLLAAIYLIPFALGATWRYLEIGYGVDMQQYGWISPFLYLFATMNSLALLFLFAYALIQSKKLFTRPLSGIMEH